MDALIQSRFLESTEIVDWRHPDARARTLAAQFDRCGRDGSSADPLPVVVNALRAHVTTDTLSRNLSGLEVVVRLSRATPGVLTSDLRSAATASALRQNRPARRWRRLSTVNCLLTGALNAPNISPAGMT
jgi:hypothetical protein